MDTQQRVRNYVVENFLMGSDDGLKPDQSLLDSGILDSTGVVELTMFIEETFCLQVADEDLVPENLDSLQRIADFIERKRAGSATHPE